MIHLTQPLLDELHSIILARAPQEACGVILPEDYWPPSDRVIEVRNRSREPETSFAIRPIEVFEHIAWWWNETGQHEGLVLWHSHPKGGIGPSRQDMQNKVPGMNHLVLALQGDLTLVPSWY